MNQQIKPLCIVFDTNIWLSSHMLKSPITAALLYSIQQNTAKIGLPEVVERELDLHLFQMAWELKNDAEKKLGQLNKFLEKTSYVKDIIAGKYEIRKGIKKRFAELDSLFYRIPFTKQHADKALEMCIRHLAPNGPKDQQFKDCAIWASVLEISKDYNVFLITNDKGFFKDRDPKKGVADNLLMDISESNASIQVFHGVEACHPILKKTEQKLDSSKILEEIKTKINTDIALDISNNEYFIKGHKSAELEYYVTPTIGKVTVIFKIEYDLVDKNEDAPISRLNPIATAKGNCILELPGYIISDLDLDVVDLTWYTSEGRRLQSSHLFLNKSGGYNKDIYLDKGANLTPIGREPAV